MPENDTDASNPQPGLFGGSARASFLEPVPLRKGQRLSAAAAGSALAGAGAASVFATNNQAGSVALLVAGGTFLLVAISGMPILGAKVKDFEINLAARWRQAAWQVAARLPNDEARAILETLEISDSAASVESLLYFIDFVLFLDRVKDAAICALGEDERIVLRTRTVIGEPLITITSAEADARVGVYGMFSPSDKSRLSESFLDQFVLHAQQTSCDAFVLVTSIPDPGDLAVLAERIRQEADLPVIIETWLSAEHIPSLRRAIDQAITEVSAPKVEPSGQSTPQPSGS